MRLGLCFSKGRESLKEPAMKRAKTPRPGMTPIEPPARMGRGGVPKRTPKGVAEQSREANEAKHAKEAQASIRDKMVDIGRGNQQAGR